MGLLWRRENEPADFRRDLDFENRARTVLDRVFYPAHTSNCIPIRGDSRAAMIFQKELHIDCILVAPDSQIKTVEEKIIRWPGRQYTAVTLETHSNLEREGDESLGKGWMVTSKADFLLYAFTQPDQSLKVWVFRFPELQRWFYKNVDFFPVADTENRLRSGARYTTRCRVVPLDAIPRDCICRGMYHVTEEAAELTEMPLALAA